MPAAKNNGVIINGEVLGRVLRISGFCNCEAEAS